jgi:Na+-translocating ferredoxin:NAD+ oxidoreductase subunit B
MTSNTAKGHWFLCNCCGCCCGQLIGARKGVPNIVNSHYFARIDPEKCTRCDTCVKTRCTIRAIVTQEKYNEVNEAKCIGCGLCVTTCPSGAITLVRKPADRQVEPPEDEMEWHRQRARVRGLDITPYE